MKFGRKATAAVLTIASTFDASNAFVSPTYNTHHAVAFTHSLPKAVPHTSSMLSSTTESKSTETETETETETPKTDDTYSDLTPEFTEAKAKILAFISQSEIPVSPTMLETLQHFINEYFTSCNRASLVEGSIVTAESTLGAMSSVIKYGVQHGLKDPFLFSTSHKALRGIDPEAEDGNEVDYYKFGVDFFKPCMDVEKSPVLGGDNLDKAMEQLENGENVIFLANHQSEADPQVVSVAFEKMGHAVPAAEMVYVAGHKVTTDPLAVPFSMGRNLICIHSKKHINADPDTKSTKMRQNIGAMGDMLKMLASPKGTALWVAPSGGRDRRDVESGDIPIADFDQKTIDMFRLMGNKSKKPTHFYSMSMRTYELCPPPDNVETGVGEQRNVRYGPVGVSISEELVLEGGLESREAFRQLAFDKAEEGYNALLEELDIN